MQKPAGAQARAVKALSRCAGGVQTLTMTHGSRHAARWPELIRGCMAVTPVTTMQPFELRVSCVSASSRMSAGERAYLLMYTASLEAAHMSPSSHGTSR